MRRESVQHVLRLPPVVNRAVADKQRTQVPVIRLRKMLKDIQGTGFIKIAVVSLNRDADISRRSRPVCKPVVELLVSAIRPLILRIPQPCAGEVHRPCFPGHKRERRNIEYVAVRCFQTFNTERGLYVVLRHRYIRGVGKVGIIQPLRRRIRRNIQGRDRVAFQAASGKHIVFSIRQRPPCNRRHEIGFLLNRDHPSAIGRIIGTLNLRSGEPYIVSIIFDLAERQNIMICRELLQQSDREQPVTEVVSVDVKGRNHYITARVLADALVNSEVRATVRRRDIQQTQVKILRCRVTSRTKRRRGSAGLRISTCKNLALFVGHCPPHCLIEEIPGRRVNPEYIIVIRRVCTSSDTPVGFVAILPGLFLYHGNRKHISERVDTGRFGQQDFSGIITDSGNIVKRVDDFSHVIAELYLLPMRRRPLFSGQDR